MNHINITTQKMAPNVTQIEMELSRQAEVDFKANVFPLLFDGATSGTFTRLRNGRVRYQFLVYDKTLIQAFKQCLYNAMLIDNGQMN